MTLRTTPGNRYRLIVTRRNASDILFSCDGPRLVLPQVEIHPQRRMAPQVNDQARRLWGIEAYSLFVTSGPTDEEANGVLMEWVGHADKAPTGTHWLPTSSIAECSDVQDARTVREAMEELDSYRRGTRSGPFARFGWLNALFRWAEEQLAPIGLRMTGHFQQFNASPAYSLIRIETDDSAVWFKATGELNRHELPVSIALARLFPGHVPAVIAVHRGWNAWLSMEVPGAELESIKDLSAWLSVADQLADLQIASRGKVGELLDSGCKDFTARKLVSLIKPHLERMAQLMAKQEKKPPAPLGRGEIVFIGEQLRDALGVLEDIGLPPTIGHLDFNPANILVQPNGCAFLDWSEACVANPVVTYEYLHEHFLRCCPGCAPDAERIAKTYRDRWSAYLSEDGMLQAIEASHLAAAFAYSVALAESHDGVGSDVLQSGFQRSLARRMFREALKWSDRMPGVADEVFSSPSLS